jgi:DNA-binding transcriptional regulator YdaS (Cro superfamily)
MPEATPELTEDILLPVSVPTLIGELSEEERTEIMDSSEEDLAALPEIAGQTHRIKYSLEQRITTVAYYSVLGSLSKAAKLAGVHPRTVVYWKQKSPWWRATLANIRKYRQDELDTKLTNIIHKSVEQLEDRIINGNTVVTKRGDKIQVPLQAKELAAAGLSVPYEKRALLRGEATSRNERSQTTEQLLAILADKFIKIAGKVAENSQPMVGRVIEGEVFYETLQEKPKTFDTDIPFPDN